MGFFSIVSPPIVRSGSHNEPNPDGRSTTSQAAKKPHFESFETGHDFIRVARKLRFDSFVSGHDLLGC